MHTSCFFRDKAGPGRYSLCKDVLLCSTPTPVHYISLLSVSARACVNLCIFFALARAHVHELGCLWEACACVIACACVCACASASD